MARSSGFLDTLLTSPTTERYRVGISLLFLLGVWLTVGSFSQGMPNSMLLMAAAVIGGRASEYLARKAVMQTAQANARKEKDLAATRVQAHQRRRMQAKQAEDARKAKEAKLKKQETDQRFADWATGANVEATVGLDETLSKQSGGLGKLSREAAPKPPAQKRTGGGFVRKK